MSDKEQIKPIKAELRGLLNTFLLDESYFPLFKEFARVAGYEGDNADEIRKALFSVDLETKEIIFSVSGLYDLFLEYQLSKQLEEKEPYRTLLKSDPIAIRRIRELAKKIFRKEDITDEDLMYVFTGNKK